MIRTLAILLIAFGSLSAFAQSQSSLRMRTQPPATTKPEESPWDVKLAYSIVTDYADTNTPRGYTNMLQLDIGYKLDENWSLSTELGARGEFFDGQIDKDSQQAYDEVISPTTSFELDYDQKFWHQHSFSLFLHGEPLWDNNSRLEGYKGLVGAGGELTLNFFGKTYSFRNSLDATELANTYYYGSDLTANPDYFVTYKMVHSIRFWHTFKLSYTFGLKTTRYLDGFWGYAYENSVGLSKTFGNLVVGLVYQDGGFTDDGTVNMWYIDQYRRITGLNLRYGF